MPEAMETMFFLSTAKSIKARQGEIVSSKMTPAFTTDR